MSQEPWTEIEIPENRPEGDWVNWKYLGGWFQVKGTPTYYQYVEMFSRFINMPADVGHKWRIELRREPDNAYDKNAIQVVAVLMLPEEDAAAFLLGYVERGAANWLAENFAPEMPIAGTLVKFAINDEAAAMKVCGLMPNKKDRFEFEL